MGNLKVEAPLSYIKKQAAMLAFLYIAVYILKKNHTYVILDKRMHNGKSVYVFLEKS